MGLLNQKGKKDDKKNKNTAKNSGQQSKFLVNNKNTKTVSGGMKKPMTGGSQRGS